MLKVLNEQASLSEHGINYA